MAQVILRGSIHDNNFVGMLFLCVDQRDDEMMDLTSDPALRPDEMVLLDSGIIRAGIDAYKLFGEYALHNGVDIFSEDQQIAEMN